jgi:hypothetical protein
MPEAKAADWDFHVGPLTIPFYEAHRGRHPFNRVQINYDATAPTEMVPYFDKPEPGIQLPTAELREFRLKMVRSKKKEADEKKQGMSNGLQVGLVDMRLHDEDNADTVLEVYTRPSFFYDHIALGMHVDVPELDDEKGGKTTIRAAYGQNPETFRGVLPNNIGVNTCPITSDGYLIWMSRGTQNLQYPGQADVRVPSMLGVPAGFMQRTRKDKKGNQTRGDYVGLAPNPFVTAKWETEEEAGIIAHLEDFELVQIGRPVTGKTGDLHAEINMMLRTGMTADQVLEAPRTGKYEGKLFALPFEPRPVAALLWGITPEHKRSKDPRANWVPAHAALVAYAAEQQFGADALIKALEETNPAQA